MYYPYDFEESEENISGVISNEDMDMYQYDDQIHTPSYETPIQSNSLNDDDEVEDDDEYVIDQSRIFNLAEVKVFLDEVICPICCHLIVAPKVCKECDQSFCGRCIDKWFKSSNQQCPCCRKSENQNQKSNYYLHQGIMDGKVPKVLLKLLSKLLLTCRYSQEGCEEIITYDFREKHENNYCQYQQLDCPNKGCYETMFRKDLEDHYLECQYGSVQCKYCSQDKLRMDIELHLYLFKYLFQLDQIKQRIKNKKLNSQSIEECICRPILCEWCQEKHQAIDFDEHLEQCEFKDIFCLHCKKKYKRYDMKRHTPISCLSNLYENSLELLQQKEQKIQELQKQIELLKSNKLMEQSDLNQSTNEVLSEKYKQDFEEEVEEVIEEDIQIEESDQEQNQQLEIENKNQLIQPHDDYEKLDKQSQKDNQYDFVEISPIQDSRLGMYTEYLQRLNNAQLKDLWGCPEDEFNQEIDWFNI